MQQATNAFAAVLKRLGLEINVKKSRIHCTAHTRPHVNGGRQGYMTQRPNILADGLPIPHVCDKGSKFLGAVIAPGATQPHVLFRSIRDKLQGWLTNLDKALLCPTAKMWIYEHAISSKLRYALAIHDSLSYTLVARLQQVATRHIKRWLKLGPGTPYEPLYSRDGWNLTSITRLWSECTMSTLSQMQRSTDESVQQALNTRLDMEKQLISTGHIRPAADAVRDRNILLNPAAARQAARDTYETTMMEKMRARAPVASKWWYTDADADMASEFSAAIHGLRGEYLPKFVQELLVVTPLPSRVNLKAWGKETYDDVKCPICKLHPQSVRHVLSSCTESLNQGRYTHRHDMVLRVLLDALIAHNPKNRVSFDLNGAHNLPAWLAQDENLLRPDGWLRTPEGTEYIIELTVPWEENFDQSNQRKNKKYSELLLRRKLTHRDTHLIVFEVGARGKLNSSCKDLTHLFDDDKKAAAECRKRMVCAAIRGSFDIWARRNETTWSC
eukprot:PhF_6_TR31499/c0_g1_i7/m.46362